MNHEAPGNRNPFHAFLKGLPTLLVLGVMGGAWAVMHHLNSGDGLNEEKVEASQQLEVDTIVLPTGKLRAGKFESAPIELQAVQHIHTVPGRLRYDETKHVDVKSPMDGLLAEILVVPGDLVQAGQLIAVIRSPEIGRARAEILKRKQRQGIAQNLLEREQTLAENLEQLFLMLDGGKPAHEIEEAFKERSLGAYRQEILSAYATMLLADELAAKVRPLAESGAVAGRTLSERENASQLAETAFHTARDQAMFAAKQALLEAEADVSEATRQLELARQSVAALLGYKESAEPSEDEALSRLEVRAPFGGSVESCGFAKNERVARGDSLLVLANTGSLYVEASIREGDWSCVALAPGTSLQVQVPALQDRTFDASVRYFGREVQTDTNAIPLVATIDNSEGLLRPGMFVRVKVPIGSSRKALSVLPESIIQHENQQFVFVDMNGGVFKRCDIMTGQASEEWVEVTDGLSLGQLVVTKGAFLLKSELLLQGDGE